MVGFLMVLSWVFVKGEVRVKVKVKVMVRE